ncbi:uncharacterized protein LOC132557708 [Ylistrum balloti]|uniref:uncharacterized protein LOC132557708 n=1 Tax=Ylistrum balloti TaxID=509963 RepID=UPI002905A529|nr:uncharacterized protein LOC132557708 [Ylistrum balloti]
MIPVLVLVLLSATCVKTLVYPTVVVAELGKSYIMTFTFRPNARNMTEFHIYNDNSDTTMISIFQNTTTVYKTWERRVIVQDNIAEGSVTVTLTSVLVEDEGWYRVSMDTGHSEQSGRFPIITYAQPVYLTITQTLSQNNNERHFRCRGNVGRPNPILRLLQSPPYNDVPNHEITKYKPTSPLPNGTFFIDHSFNVSFPFSDNGTYVVCDVTHEIVLGKQLRPIRSRLELVTVKRPSVSGQSITITGTSTLLTPASELKITCQPSTVSITDVNSISIKKNTSTTDYTVLVSVSYDKPSGSSVYLWGTTGHQGRQGVTVTGNVDTLAGAQLVLTIAANRTTCTDGGAYQCQMGVTLIGGSGGTASDDKYVTAKESPTYTNSLSVTPLPNVNSVYYSVGTVLTFSCTGTVGTDKQRHTWCYKRASDSTYTGYPIASHIDQNDDGLVKENCNYRRTSTLTYNVTSADSNTTFMCEPYTGTVCGSNPPQLKSYYSIRNYVTGGSTGGQDDGGSVSNAGTIAGVVIGVFAAILLIVLIVYFVVIRRRGGGETYNTKEDGSPESAENGGPAHTEGPVYSVPDKNRTRGKHGHDNNALDEPREEKRSRRRDRDRRDYDDGRGHSNKAMYDYSDDDRDGGSMDGGGHPVGIGSSV